MNKLPDWLKLVKGDFDKDDDEEVNMLFSDQVGYNPDNGTGVSANAFGQALAMIPRRKKITLDINSMGGRCDDGMAMHNMLIARGANTRVIGYAGSMGAILAQAGKKRIMMPGTMMLIHNPAMDMGPGDYRDAAAASTTLQIVKKSLVDLMSARSGLSKKRVSDMMDETTLMDSATCKELGFCDEVGEGSPAFNYFETARVVKASGFFKQEFRQDAGETKNKIMKTLIAKLANLKLIPTADMTDEVAIASQVETSLTTLRSDATLLTTANTRVTTLEGELKTFKDQQKSRIVARVEKAITDKLVKSERKDKLIEMGVRDEVELDTYLNDIAEARGQAAPARRGAPPVPPANNGDDVESQMKSLRDDLKDASPTEAVVISRKLRELRGHGKLFDSATVKK